MMMMMKTEKKKKEGKNRQKRREEEKIRSMTEWLASKIFSFLKQKGERTNVRREAEGERESFSRIHTHASNN